jgi:hypothetical protein
MSKPPTINHKKSLLSSKPFIYEKENGLIWHWIYEMKTFRYSKDIKR